MAAHPCDANTIDSLRVRWEAIKTAQTLAIRQGSEWNLALFFRDLVQGPSPQVASILAPVQQLDVPEEDKIRIYSIAAGALFKNACPSADQEAINEAIRAKLEGYSKPSTQLANELNVASRALAMLPVNQQTPEMIGTVMGFFRGLEGRYLETILAELPEFSEGQRADYFMYRRTKSVVKAVNLFQTDKCTALKIIIPTIKAFNNDECRTHKYLHILGLIPQDKRLEVLQVLSDILRYIPSNRLAIDFLKTLEVEMQEVHRVPFLKRFTPLIQEVGVVDAFEALGQFGPYIEIIKGSIPITRARILLWLGLVNAMEQGATPEEENMLGTGLRRIPDTEIDEFCRVVTPLCSGIPTVANRLTLLDFFLVFVKRGLPAEMNQFLALIDSIKVDSDQPVFSLKKFLETFPLAQVYALLPGYAELLKNPLPQDSDQTLSTTITTLLAIGLQPQQMAIILKTAARLYKELNVPPAILITALELLPPDLHKTCDSKNPRLQAHLAILSGIEFQWVQQLNLGISELQENILYSAAPLCSQSNSGGVRANMLSILAHFPVQGHAQAAARYLDFLKTAHIKDGSNCQLTEAMYRKFLMRVPQDQRLDAIEHFGIVFDDEQSRAPETRASEIVRGQDQNNPRAFLSALAIGADDLIGYHSWMQIMQAIPQTTIGAVFRWTALNCQGPIGNKAKVLQAMSKLPPNLLEPIAKQIHAQLDSLKTGAVIANKIEELASKARK